MGRAEHSGLTHGLFGTSSAFARSPLPCSWRAADDAISAAERQADRLLLRGVRVPHEEFVIGRNGIERLRITQ